MQKNKFLKNQSTYIKGITLVFLGAVCFSTKAIFAKLAFKYGVDGITILMIRMLFSLPFYIVILFFENNKKSIRIPQKTWTTILILGIIGYYLAALFDFIGLQYVSANLERIVIFTYPTFVLLMGKLFFNRKILPIQFLAILICYIGIILAFYSDKSIYNTANLGKGCVFILLSSLTYAFYLVNSDTVIKKIGTVRFTCISMIISCMAVLIHFAILHGFSIFNFPKQVYWLGICIAIISTVLPSFLMTNGIRLIGSSNMSIVASIGPIATIFMSYFILKEHISLLHLLGTFFVLIGVLVISFFGNKAKVMV